MQAATETAPRQRLRPRTTAAVGLLVVALALLTVAWSAWRGAGLTAGSGQRGASRRHASQLLDSAICVASESPPSWQTASPSPHAALTPSAASSSSSLLSVQTWSFVSRRLGSSPQRYVFILQQPPRVLPSPIVKGNSSSSSAASCHHVADVTATAIVVDSKGRLCEPAAVERPSGCCRDQLAGVTRPSDDEAAGDVGELVRLGSPRRTPFDVAASSRRRQSPELMYADTFGSSCVLWVRDVAAWERYEATTTTAGGDHRAVATGGVHDGQSDTVADRRRRATALRALGTCCDNFALCVAGCLQPENKEVRYAGYAIRVKQHQPIFISLGQPPPQLQGMGSSLSVRRPKSAAPFDYCLARCRATPESLFHENRYRSDFHHCFDASTYSAGWWEEGPS